MRHGPLLAILLALPAAAPAAAQTGINGAGQASGLSRDTAWQLRRIDRRTGRARDEGALSRREARAVDREQQRIRRLAARYARDGLSEAEAREIQTRIYALRDLAQAPLRPVPPPPPARGGP